MAATTEHQTAIRTVAAEFQAAQAKLQETLSGAADAAGMVEGETRAVGEEVLVLVKRDGAVVLEKLKSITSPGV